MAQTVKVEVEVLIEQTAAKKAGDKPGFTFLSLKLPGGQPVLIPGDVPMPRRFLRDLEAVAGRVARGEPADGVDPAVKAAEEAAAAKNAPTHEG